MPATMPENSTRGSSARIRITSCFGRKFRITETTRTLKGSGLVPWNTVIACPTIPGRTSESGRMAGGGPDGITARSRTRGDAVRGPREDAGIGAAAGEAGTAATAEAGRGVADASPGERNARVISVVVSP